MNELVENKVSRWARVTRVLKRRAFWLGSSGVILTVVMALAVIFYWESIQALGGYGYLGAFFIGLFGGATYLAPIPMTPVVFAMGTVMRPSFAPYLGPVFVGAAAGLGETISALSIYMTGYGGGAVIISSRHSKIQAVYSRLLDWMERRGGLILFILSAVLNPFFYPAALAAGALRFGIRKYFLVCLSGKIIKGMTVAAAGYWGLGSILRALGIPL